MQQFKAGQTLTERSKRFSAVCTIQKIRRIGVLSHPGIRRTDDQNATGLQVAIRFSELLQTVRRCRQAAHQITEQYGIVLLVVLYHGRASQISRITLHKSDSLPINALIDARRKTGVMRAGVPALVFHRLLLPQMLRGIYKRITVVKSDHRAEGSCQFKSRAAYRAAKIQCLEPPGRELVHQFNRAVDEVNHRRKFNSLRERFILLLRL